MTIYVNLNVLLVDLETKMIKMLRIKHWNRYHLFKVSRFANNRLSCSIIFIDLELNRVHIFTYRASISCWAQSLMLDFRLVICETYILGKVLRVWFYTAFSSKWAVVVEVVQDWQLFTLLHQSQLDFKSVRKEYSQYWWMHCGMRFIVWNLMVKTFNLKPACHPNLSFVWRETSPLLVFALIGKFNILAHWGSSWWKSFN